MLLLVLVLVLLTVLQSGEDQITVQFHQATDISGITQILLRQEAKNTDNQTRHNKDVG